MVDIEDVIATGDNLDPRRNELLEESDWKSARITQKEGLIQNVTVELATYAARANDDVILMANLSAVATVTLPASSPGKKYTIKMLDTNQVTVDSDEGDIDGVSAYVLLSQYDFIEVIFALGEWHIISKYEV